MSSGADISTLYREFTQALTDVLAEHAVGPASWSARQGSRCREKASGIQRAWIFFSGRNRISTVGSIANYRSRGAAVAAGATELGGSGRHAVIASLPDASRPL